MKVNVLIEYFFQHIDLSLRKQQLTLCPQISNSKVFGYGGGRDYKFVKRWVKTSRNGIAVYFMDVIRSQWRLSAKQF